MGLSDGGATKYYLEEVELDMPEHDLNAFLLDGALGTDVDVRIAAHERVDSMLRASHLNERQQSNRRSRDSGKYAL
jgi:hypothetical protein